MRVPNLLLIAGLVLGFSPALHVGAEEPTIPPSVASISPAGMERGSTATFTIEGRNLSGATEVIFDAPGVSGKVTQIVDVPEKIMGPRAGVDTGAQVPLGKKQTATLDRQATRCAWRCPRKAVYVESRGVEATHSY